jgi:hypothetical protein
MGKTAEHQGDSPHRARRGGSGGGQGQPTWGSGRGGSPSPGSRDSGLPDRRRHLAWKCPPRCVPCCTQGYTTLPRANAVRKSSAERSRAVLRLRARLPSSRVPRPLQGSFRADRNEAAHWRAALSKTLSLSNLRGRRGAHTGAPSRRPSSATADSDGIRGARQPAVRELSSEADGAFSKQPCGAGGRKSAP